MSLQRLNSDGSDFSVTKWNTNIDSLEDLHLLAIGRCIISGLTLSLAGGLGLSIADGVFSAASIMHLASIPTFNAPTNGTYYVWIDESGTVSTTVSAAYPGGNAACLGRIITTGIAITSFDVTNRQELLNFLSEITNSGGYDQVPVAGTSIVLSSAVYDNRVIEFTGTLTASINVIVPNFPGTEWTFADSSTGAFTVTVKTGLGTGITLTHGKTCKLWCDGTNVRRSTADV